MLYIRICFDRPGLGDKRNALRAAHRAYFQPNLEEGARVRLLQAGPLCIDDHDDTNLGSFMMLEAPSLEDAVAFHDGDPFTIADMFERASVHRWDRHIG